MNTMKKCSTCGTLYSGDLCSKCMAGFAQKSTDPTAPPEEMPFKPGETFHGLEILELIGRGGMGVVYKARQPALDRMVALKILPRKMALDPDFQNRFIREAKALGSLSHPNIVAVYDFGAEGGFFFFAMEYVDGTNLRQILRDRKLSPEQGLKIVPQLCDALEYAHGEGVVHRDIKPENILLDRKGRVKIADFGLAKLVGADAPVNITMTNMVMGTPHYMAPEQVENPKGVDHRADIYAIGVVLYEMLTGELPIGRFEVPSKKVQVDVRLDDVVLKALEKAPERRYQNASDVKDAVTKATAVTSVESYSPTILTPKPAKKSSNLPMLAMGGVTLVAVIVAVAALLKTSGPAPTPPAVTVNPPPGETVPVTKPPAAEPFDFARLYFGPQDRPGGYVFQQPGPGLPRNPMPAKDTAEIETLVKILDDIGLQNVARGDVKQGYVSAWFRWEAAFIAIETPISERLEREFQAMQNPENRWTYRKGDLLVLAWTKRKENRELFTDLVLRLKKKLGLPDEAPEIPLAHLMLEKSAAFDGLTLTTETPDPPTRNDPYELSLMNLKIPGVVQRSLATLTTAEGGSTILTYAAFNFITPQAAAAAEKRLGSHAWPGSLHILRTEILRSGKTLAVLLMEAPEVHIYERVAGQIRLLMGAPERSFDTMVPVAGEMPAGYQLGESRTGVAAIVKDLGLENVSAPDIARAWQATVKPHGSMVLFQVEDSTVRSAIRDQLRKRGAAEDGNGCIFGVEGPDDETLDALENLLRQKNGWDANRPRAILIHRVQLTPADLPQGYSLEGVAYERRQWKATLRGPLGAIEYIARESHNYGEIDQIKKEWKPKPADVQLFNYAIVAQASGSGESSWPALDALEAVMRRKMRMGPAVAEDFAVDAVLPAGCQLLPRQDIGFPANPRTMKTPSAVQHSLREWWQAEIPGFVRGWAAVVNPAETQVFILEADPGAATADLAARLRKAIPEAKHLAIHQKGSIFAVVRSDRPEDTEFGAVDGIVRAKLRTK
jgi:serine/threonine protein kinase